MMTNTTSSVVLSLGARVTGDVVSFGIVLGTIIKLLPPLAALISILWIGFQFYWSEPMKDWRAKRSEERKERNGTD